MTIARGEQVFRIYRQYNLNNPVLIAGWVDDASEIGEKTVDYIIKKAGCTFCAEVLPEPFFPMSGIKVVDDVAVFPESKFYVSPEHNLLVFKSSIPWTDWHRFLQAMLNVALSYGVQKLYTVGAMVSVAAHTMPRVLISIVNSSEVKSELEQHNVMTGSDFETPPAQKPTLSSYLGWLSRQRDMTAINLWVPVPFYMVQAHDPRACKRLIYFFNDKYGFDIDFTAIDDEISVQNGAIADLFEKSPVLVDYIRRLETGEGLDQDQSEKLAQAFNIHLSKKF